MVDTESIRLGDEERDQLLGNGGTGVISFSTGTGEFPYTIPVSYGYDAAETTFYFRLAERDEDKERLHQRPVSFVTHSQVDGQWRSVVAAGSLQETTDESIATETLAGLERVSIPFVDIFGEPMGDVNFAFYRLVPAELAARTEAPSEP